MKAIIMSHENGGSYCIDSTGSFHFVEGHQDKEIGTEITIQTKKPARSRRFFYAFAAFAAAAMVAVVMCSLLTSGQGLASPQCRRGEIACISRCAEPGELGCLGIGGCDFFCAGN